MGVFALSVGGRAPGGLAGALAGAWLLPRANTAWIKAAFSLLLLWAAFRLLTR